MPQVSQFIIGRINYQKLIALANSVFLRKRLGRIIVIIIRQATITKFYTESLGINPNKNPVTTTGFLFWNALPEGFASGIAIHHQ
ncbi:MAG: hypothetical protein RMY34_16135 [Aulosira sp. DedQUE10]|nr:hypothetical protein [Aulosira sp. DedQUE10]